VPGSTAIEYWLLFSGQYADTVRCAGVEYSEVRFQPNVIGCPDAILKKDVDACGGCVIVSPPAGAVAGMDRCDAVGVVEFVFAFPLPLAVFVVPALLPGLELPFVGFALEAVFVFGGWFAFDMAAAADEEEEENAERDDSDDGKATPPPAGVPRPLPAGPDVT
jgi:hypothetical protein